ncbi:MAG: putative periplasmic C4-dicarboxylate binding protein DctP [Myxococcales bacterium]|nr:putative periplasmic C4-dicarboxylate binding protein DctP [Myxococcales bacterium]
MICALSIIAALAGGARAEPVTLRVATAAPDGTAWARIMRAMARDLGAESHGEMAIKYYFGGIAGDEVQTLERMKRGQLDAVFSGGMLCMKLSPSMRALRLLGLFQSREEAMYVLGRLRPTIDREFAEHGFRNMAEASLGSDMLFSRAPVTSMAELKKTRFWYWNLDEAMQKQLQALGTAAVGLPLEEAGRAYDESRIDGFLAVPVAALANQWSAKTRYLSELRLGFLPGCMVMTNSAFDALPIESRGALMLATGKMQAAIEEMGRTQDAALLGGLFERQGLKKVALSASFASEFFEAARTARDALRNKLIPGELIDRITGWVADYRAEYSGQRQPAK